MSRFSEKLNKVLGKAPARATTPGLDTMVARALGDKWDPAATYSCIPVTKMDSKYHAVEPLAYVDVPNIRTTERFAIYKKES